MSAVPADLRIDNPWRVAVPALLALLVVTLLLYRDTALAMVGIWMRSDTFAHAVLVPPISLWLVWRQRQRLALLTPQPQPWVLLPLMGVAMVWLLADLVIVNAASQFALVAMLVLAVPAVLGLQVALTLLFPLLFLFFAVPFGEFMLPSMMDWTADFTIMALQFSGVPVYREGLQFVIPTGNWSVVEACSGVRYLIASFMVGTLFAYLNYRSTRRRVVFMLVSLAVPIIANWLRAYMIVMLGHLSGNTIAVGADHLIYGWVFFGIVIMIMFLIGARWSEPDEPAPVLRGAYEPPLAARSHVASRALLVTTALCALVVALPQSAAQAIHRADAVAGVPSLELPQVLAAGWTRDASSLTDWRPRFENPSAVATSSFTRNGRTVGVHLAYYRGQNADRKLVGSQNVLVTSTDKHWNQLSSATIDVPVGERVVPFRTAELLGKADTTNAQRQQLVVWRLYWIDGRWVRGDAAAKLLNAVTRLRGRGDDGAALFLFTDNEATAASTMALQSFAGDNLGAIDALLRQTRDAR